MNAAHTHTQIVFVVLFFVIFVQLCLVFVFECEWRMSSSFFSAAPLAFQIIEMVYRGPHTCMHLQTTNYHRNAASGLYSLFSIVLMREPAFFNAHFLATTTIFYCSPHFFFRSRSISVSLSFSHFHCAIVYNIDTDFCLCYRLFLAFPSSVPSLFRWWAPLIQFKFITKESNMRCLCIHCIFGINSIVM